ncbi:MAG: transglutaminase family protein [Phormidesmis sp.]
MNPSSHSSHSAAVKQHTAATRWLHNASLCSLATALWGWQTGLFWVAIPIILILEARHVVKQRWEISLSDLKEAAKLSGALVTMLFVVLVTTKKSLFIYSLLQWLPLAGLPLVIAQTYGLGVQAHLQNAFSNPHLLRRGIHTQQSSLNLHYLYFGICIVAASAADTDHFFFYGIATALTALLLWPLRPKRSAPVVWVLLFCLSTGLGFVGHRQLAQFQQHLETQVIAMLGDIASGRINPNGTATQMGSIGRLKRSNRIIFRVAEGPTKKLAEGLTEREPSSPFPLLLQEAAYNRYQLSAWSAENSLFTPVPPDEEEGSWILSAANETTSSITISTDLERGDGVLTLPRGVSSIRQLPVKEMQRNQYGAVQVDAIGNAAYQVQFNPDNTTSLLELAPTATDLQIPKVDKAAVETTLTKLNLTGDSERATVNKIAAYLQDFQYSLDLLQPPANTSAVSDFLLNTQAGHCEYFASTTALLLRGAGIPARYAVGYSVHEFSPLEGQYIVRSRDAHAWTLAYLENTWQVLDTTPPDWTTQDKERTSSFQRSSDFLSFLGFQVSYRIRQLGELGLKEILMIVIPLFLYLLWRSIQSFQGQKKNTLEASNTSENARPVPKGLDSELYEIEQLLNAQDLHRQPAESFLQWGDRIQQALSEPQWLTFQKILALHYQYRFDPHSLSTAEREQLRTLSKKWITDYPVS